MKKRGNILTENIIFIILNLVFFTILILFVFKQGAGAIILEQSYAKQIALLIDSSQPSMLLKLNMEKAKKLAEKNGIPFEDVVQIKNNIIQIKLSKNSGYTYSFFNNVDVSPPYVSEEVYYIFSINNYNQNE
ncbi:MAG: hypothetical protein KJ646_01955 [Nanoarchaeota archaeon]|nr:hypothetical protein [Nanoarchaeota archaeon]MBU4116848.1 hypothetical protein [Nanoarchaeota archaeon]